MAPLNAPLQYRKAAEPGHSAASQLDSRGLGFVHYAAKLSGGSMRVATTATGQSCRVRSKKHDGEGRGCSAARRGRRELRGQCHCTTSGVQGTVAVAVTVAIEKSLEHMAATRIHGRADQSKKATTPQAIAVVAEVVFAGSAGPLRIGDTAQHTNESARIQFR